MFFCRCDISEENPLCGGHFRLRPAALGQSCCRDMGRSVKLFITFVRLPPPDGASYSTRSWLAKVEFSTARARESSCCTHWAWTRLVRAMAFHCPPTGKSGSMSFFGKTDSRLFYSKYLINYCIFVAPSGRFLWLYDLPVAGWQKWKICSHGSMYGLHASCKHG